jgi:hypothetical protein
MTTPTDTIDIEPALIGIRGRAWRVDLDAIRKRVTPDKVEDACVEVWIVEAPWAHPFWHSYVVGLIHLRPMEDGRDTKFHIDGATHEMWVDALDPDQMRQPAIKGETHWSPLQPTNFAAQFIADTDDAARACVQAAVHMICRGLLSPDTDFTWRWIELFGDNMVKEVGMA